MKLELISIREGKRFTIDQVKNCKKKKKNLFEKHKDFN